MNARNPKHTATAAIDMEIEHPIYGWIPFTASPDDCEQRGRDLHAQALAGDFGAIAAYVEPPLADRRNAAIAKTYADVDAVYAAAVGNRAPEYEQAEQAALAYQAAGYAGTASPYISGYAVKAGITDQQSADLILARATSLRAAVLSMRDSRFDAKKAMSDATTQAELDAAVAAWDAFIVSTRASLGL